jgi:predicted amidohydrolase YtcJ
VVHPDDLPRFAALGVTANAQPLWAQHEPQMDELTIPFLGPDRSRLQYPFGSLAGAGAAMAMGSDWSVSTPDVMAQAQIAVHRREAGGGEAFLPEEALSLDRVLAAFTAGSAFVNHAEHEVGTIEPGKLADLAVLDRDPFAVEDLATVKVDLTYVGGQLVYARS